MVCIPTKRAAPQRVRPVKGICSPNDSPINLRRKPLRTRQTLEPLAMVLTTHTVHIKMYTYMATRIWSPFHGNSCAVVLRCCRGTSLIRDSAPLGQREGVGTRQVLGPLTVAPAVVGSSERARPHAREGLRACVEREPARAWGHVRPLVAL